jgi:L-ascorbate metabolism protein UlaG (beta-lactamase superfamily)
MSPSPLPLVSALAVALLLPAAHAAAKCLPIAAAPARVVLAALPEAGTVRLTYIDHSSFLIETAGGASAVTDYYGFPLDPVPDAVTMNNAHRTHYTDLPDAAIPNVLRGWASEGIIVTHDVTIDDLRIWNVPTNVRDVGGTRINGNSIFVFEVDGLCIAHLGHLHHTLTDVHLGELGQIDVVLAPADGSYTISHELLVEVIGQIGPSLIIPMHYFGTGRLSNLLALLEAKGYTVEYQDENVTTVSRMTMPSRTVRVLGSG